MPTSQDVNRTLDRIRPFLELDGGSVELVRVTEEGIVEVR
ncbi:MAG: NifU family protein, partial [Bacteroidota bacterium]